MTKEEIKLIKEQQKKLEDSNKNEITTLRQLVAEKESTIKAKNKYIENLCNKIDFLSGQVATLQSGLTGEEVDYYHQ